MKKFMFIGAHPDDIELACGGLIKNLIKVGYKVFPVICSWGTFGGQPCERIEEQHNALSFLNIFESDYTPLGWQDTEIAITGENISTLESIILNKNPDFIFTHYPNDTHQDHRVVAEMVKSICYRKNKNLFYFDSNSSVGFIPNFFEPIDWGIKKNLLGIFKSQILRSNILEKAEAKNKLYGIQSGNEYAEGFIVDRYIRMFQ